jgi:hypothetical protein
VPVLIIALLVGAATADWRLHGFVTTGPGELRGAMTTLDGHAVASCAALQEAYQQHFGLRRLRDVRSLDALRRLRHHEEVAGYAARALGDRRGIEALPELKSLSGTAGRDRKRSATPSELTRRAVVAQAWATPVTST